MKRYIIITLAAMVAIVLHANAQDLSNKGREFWIGYGDHVRMHSTQSGIAREKMSLYITSDVNTTGNVSIAGIGFNQSFTVTANQTTIIDIPNTAALNVEGLFNMGIHVTAVNPIVVYSHIYAQNVSGATICFPVNTLGKEYYSVNYTQRSNEQNAYSYFFVIATEDNTTVEITPTALTKGGKVAGSPFNVTLNKGQVYQVLADNDLTGSVIKSITSGTNSCKRIAVFCGSSKIYINNGVNNNVSADNLYQQAFPNQAWGKKYVTVPSSGREYNIYRIIKSDPTTQVTLNGVLIPGSSFINGFYYEFSGTTPNYIESDKPIMVAQYFVTQTRTGGPPYNDPEMIYLSPLEQTIDKVTLYSTNEYKIVEHYINIVVRNAGTALSNIKLDGNNISSHFTTLSQNTDYSYAQIQVSSGTHNLTSDSGFNAIAYGFGDAESYGYSAGTNIKDLYQFASIRNTYASVDFPAACKGSPFTFSIVLPYQPLSLKWQFSNDLKNYSNFRDTAVTNPVFDSTWTINGKTLYRYPIYQPATTIPQLYTVSVPNTYPITITADNPTSTGCSGEQLIDYELEVFDQHTAGIKVSYSGCQNDTATIEDVPDPANTRKIIYSYWDMGSGFNNITGNPPTQVYTTPGTNTVKHYTITDVGCISDTTSKNIIVNPLPVAAFTVPSILCETKEIQFTDASTISSGNIQNWSWNFGDGGSALIANPKHIYSLAGSYKVKLTAVSDSGCRNIDSSILLVNYQPQVDFITPKICVDDGVGQFLDNSTIGDGTQASFTYQWSFSGGGTSTLKNPTVPYAAIGNYSATLKVTSNKGCFADSTKTFTVNSSVKTANFSIINEHDLCSNRNVYIKDSSVLDFGNIVKTEIYWDYGNFPTIKEVNDTPQLGVSVYEHLYSDFLTATKTIQVRYVVYSGTTCLRDTIKTITLKRSPKAQFLSLNAICEEAPTFLITQASDINGLPGTGTYSGNGIISSNGRFNPQTAGAGIHQIFYHYVATNGCDDTISQTIQVHPTPKVNAGRDFLLLEGDSAYIQAQASGSGLTYLWLPNTTMANNHVLKPAVAPVDHITYTLTVTSMYGCTASDTVRITVLKKIKVPNVFSPNGDGINDTWILTNIIDYPGSRVMVFNRYGQTVFESYGYPKPWDGTYNGKPLPIGTYYYIIEPKNGRATMSGNVTILR